MGMKIIKDGDKFGLFSTISDRIIAIDCDEAEMVQIWKDRAAERAEKEMKEWLAEVKGEKPHMPNTGEVLTVKKALKDHQWLDPKLAVKHPEYKEEVDFDVELRKLKNKLKKEK